MDDLAPLTHDQVIARVQAFYSHLRRNYEEWRETKDLRFAEDQCTDPEVRRIIRLQYELASELLELYSHTFESVIYTWMD